jgi:hypothetical protein
VCQYYCKANSQREKASNKNGTALLQKNISCSLFHLTVKLPLLSEKHKQFQLFKKKSYGRILCRSSRVWKWTRSSGYLVGDKEKLAYIELHILLFL